VLGPVSDVPVGSAKIYPNRHVVVTQPTAGTYEGFSATCPHAGCTVAGVEQGTIVCPCHGSRYSIEGTSIKGPAKGSLYRYAIKLDGSGHLIVDRDQQFEEKHWDDQAAWVKA
jgi:Rieske Fe-S protein